MSFKLMDTNLVDQSVFTASSENALFPVSNLKDTRRSKVYRSTSNSDTVTLDMQETSEVDTIFVVANKRDGFGVSTVTVEFNGTSDFTTPAYSIAVPFSVKFGVGFIEFTKVEYRFARIVMTSTLGYCELSKVYIGKKLEMKRSINFGWTIKDNELSINQSNRYGQKFTDVIGRQKQINVSFSYVDKDDLDLINSVLDDRGESKPIYIILGCDTMTNDNRRFSGPVTLNDIPTITNPLFNKYSLSFALSELT